MEFLVACGLIMIAIVLAAGLLEAWARYRRWPGYMREDEIKWRLRR